MPTLISFLGKSQLDCNFGYRKARYRFPDGTERESAYFGLELAAYLKATQCILIGTPSSMWDILVENIAGDHGEEELRLSLMDAVKSATVTEPLLSLLLPSISAQTGCSIEALVIPHSAQFEDQQNLLQRLAEKIPPNANVVIDVTHGFRHLAMLAVSATRYLQHARKVHGCGLYYGALEMNEKGVAPVVELSGLAHLQEWAEAMAAHEASGNIAVFAPLLARDGLARDMAHRLKEGWARMNIHNIHDAAQQLLPVYNALNKPLVGASELFRERLRRLLRWVSATTLAEKQRLLALQALERGDLLRAALFGLESFLSREVTAAGDDPLDYTAKKRVEAQFKAELKEGEHPDWKRNAYWLLKNVRNALAHGTVPTYPPHAQLLKNPERLRRELDATINRLTNT